MARPRLIVASHKSLLAFPLLFAAAVCAQEQKSTKAAEPLIVTATATAERVRVGAPGTVVQLRVEIYDANGRKLIDTEQRGGNVFDWHLQEGTGERVSDGAYLCVVTVKSLSGRLTQKLGVITVSGQSSVAIRTSTVAELNAPQSQAVGPIEIGEEGLTVMTAENPTAAAVVTHDGNEGQVSRTRGALSFRFGNFFAGEDREQMRLTEDGKLGIGTDKPESKLDVNGDIRTTGTLRAQRIEFPNGTVQTSGQNGRVDDQGNVTPNVAGTGTQNQLSKWTDNAGTLGDSVLTEVGGRIGVGTSNPQFKLDLVDSNSGAGGFQLANPTSGTTAQLQNRLVNNNGAFAYYGITSSAYTQAPILSNRAFFGSYQADTVIWTQTANDILFATNGINSNTERMRIKANGNVGIGYSTPVAKLDVGGDINTSTQYNIGGSRALGVSGAFFFLNSNIFAGVSAGSALTPDPVGKGGNNNSFFGFQAGMTTTEGYNNTFLGRSAGLANTTGSNNTIVGQNADFGAGNLNNATALGAGAIVSQSDSLVLGNGANVGIGTSAPVSVLHLNGNHNDFALTFTNQSNTSGVRGYRIAFDSDRLTFQSAADSGAFAANQMTIDPPTGNVGIGTTAPSFKLHINDPSNTGLRVQNNTSGGTVAGFGGFGAFQIDTISTAGGRFTIKENGNTGIGTNNPNAKLQVVGGNVYIANPNSLIITSPNGTCWLVTVSNTGTLSSIATPCP